MIITIDTSKDSVADIRKAILLLEQIAGGYSSSSSSANSYLNPNGVQSNSSSGWAVNQGFGASNYSSNADSANSSSSFSQNQQPINQQSASASQQTANDGFAAMFGGMEVLPVSNQTPSQITPTSQQITQTYSDSGRLPKKQTTYDFETYE